MNRTKEIYFLSDELDIKQEDIKSYFDYLDTLKDSGAVNMFGAIHYLISHDSNLTRESANRILKGWMDSLNDR